MLQEDGQAAASLRLSAAPDPPGLASSDVSPCPTGKDNDGFNERPLNHVTIDLAKK